ncbi:nicotinate-nucleotide adenylyltransferase [Peptococcaceae bacterium 1198_IL3148]
MKSLAIMGGTFDPIHNGHLVVAEQARHKFECDKVVFVPAAQPPHKDQAAITTSVDDRLTMTRLAVASNPWFEVSTLEIERPGPSYTIDTVKAVKEVYRPEKLYFITGADAVLEILTWKSVEELLGLCYFIAATRPGYDLSDLQKKLNILPNVCLKKIIPFYVPSLAISSTDIRNRVQRREPIKYLLPEPVENYIKEHLLYL